MNKLVTSKVKSHHRGVDSARFSDTLALASTIFAVSIGIYLIHGAIPSLKNFPNQTIQSLAQLFGILTTLSALYGITLAARPRYIENSVGLDVMLVWHRYLGEASAVFLIIHMALELVSRSSLGGYWLAFKALTGGDSYMALASIGALGFLVITFTSLKTIRRKLSYETWYFIHLTIYGAVLLGFWHQIYLGIDFVNDTTARNYWIALHLLVLVIVIKARLGSLIKAIFRPLTLSSINQSAHDTLELTLTGSSLSKMKAESGQFAMLRFITPSLWFESHPFSLSAAPKKTGIRFTIKTKGDATRLLKNLQVGQKVILEGPYGAIVKSQIGTQPTILIAGGVGIAPIRALLEDFTPENQPHVIFRVKTEDDIVHLQELKQLLSEKKGSLTIITGSTRELKTNPFDPAYLKSTIPDLALRQAILCGPESMVLAGVRGLLSAGLPSESIHYERSWW